MTCSGTADHTIQIDRIFCFLYVKERLPWWENSNSRTTAASIFRDRPASTGRFRLPGDAINRSAFQKARDVN